MKRTAISIITFLSLLSANAQTNDNTPQHGFTWGVEVGSGIDMGGDNMSTLNLAALIGYRTSWINFAGVGLGIDMMMSNSCRSFPIYGMIRSSFAEKPKLFFAEMRAGVALNQATDVPDRTNLFLQPGAGICRPQAKPSLPT